MSSSYLPYDPRSRLLLPPSLDEWLPPDHLSHFISDTVDHLDLSAFHAAYDLTRRGNQPYHPAMMVKVLLYAYSSGQFSSRRIARGLHEDVALRSLAAGNYPSHRTICDFRQRHLTDLEGLFVQVVRIARECKLVRLGTIAIDGTKIQANASRHKAMSYERMLSTEKALKQQIQDLLQRAEATDCSESDKEEAQTSIPAELALRQKRLKTIQEAKARLEARQTEQDQSQGRSEGDDRKSKDKDGRPTGGRYSRDFGVPPEGAQESFTDSDSRIMRHSGGHYEYSYNCQAAVDRESRMVIGVMVSNCAADAVHLIPVVDAVEATMGRQAKTILADAGYRSEANFQQLESKRISPIIALGREDKAASIDTKNLPYTERMRKRMACAQGRKAYKERKWIVEPVFGWAKRILGFRQMSMRGLAKAKAEWSLVCTVLNLKRMHVMSAAMA